MENAFYYREGYYLFPDEYSDVNLLRAAAKETPITLKVRQLVENHRIGSIIEKGICIAPYFYNEYGYPEQTLTIEDYTDVFPVEATLLTQKEYNERIRNVILTYCPGCCRYKPISNRVQSLNGHFEEIALNSVCFYRQNSKPSPRVFRKLLWSFGGLAQHFDPAERSAEDTLDFIKSVLYIKYVHGQRNPEEPILHVGYKPNFFIEQLTIALSEYIEKHLNFTKFRIAAPAPSEDVKAQVETLLLDENRTVFQKECKKYGVSIAFLTYDSTDTEKIKRSLSELFYHDMARVLYEENGKLCLLLLDQCELIKALHFRSPLMSSCSSVIEIYDQYGISKNEVSFDMKQISL